MSDRARALSMLDALLAGGHHGPPTGALVAHFGGLRRLLLARPSELSAAGLDGERIARITATRGLWRALLRPTRARRLLSPQLVAGALPHLSWHEVEEVWVLPVDAGLRLLSRVLVARGSAASCAVTAAEIFGPALRSRARGLFVVHNHPSGDPTPSASDLAFTERLVAASKLLSLRVEDHLVVGADRWASILTRRRGSCRHPLRPRRTLLKAEWHGDAPLVASEGGHRDAPEGGLDARLEGGVAARVGADGDLRDATGGDAEADVGACK